MNESNRSGLDERNRFLVELDDATRPLEEPELITRTAAALLGRYLRVNRCAYADVEPDQDTFNLTGDYNADVPSIVGRYTFAQFGAECLRLMRTGEPYIVTDSETDPRTEAVRDSYRATQIRAVICVSVLKVGRFAAAMAVHQVEPRQWTRDEVELVQLVASRCWESIERTRVTGQLRESERRLRMAQRAGRVGTFDWHIPSGQVYWSPELDALYGRPPGSFSGNLSAWAECCEPVDAAEVLRQMELKIANREDLFDYEFRAVLPDGRHRWLRGQAQFEYTPEGSPIRMRGVNVDVDDQKRVAQALADSEARFRGLVQATPECVKIVAPDGELLFMNQAGLAMIESASPEQVAKASVFDLIAPEHRTQWREQHLGVCGGAQSSWEFEIIGLLGTRRWMETHAVPLPLPDGRMAQLAVTREITARKKQEAERERLLAAETQARGEAERASALKDEFLATLSHELRTPLNAIVGWTHVLAGNLANPALLSEGLTVIGRNARAQAQIIDDLLDMNRIMSGRVRLEVRRMPLAEVLNDAVDSVRPAAQAKDIRVTCVLDTHAGPVAGDPIRLQQIFWNLLSNAIKFTSRGGRVNVTLERVHSHLEISVTDTGEGIAPDFLPHVFDRFRQSDGSTTRRHGGLGLGLAISRQLVELHGGTLRAASAGVGQGATFVVSLPLSPLGTETDAREHAHSTLPLESSLDGVSLEGLRVLLVDDEIDARSVLRRVLETRGARVTEASSVAEALAALERDGFDVLISDIGMPEEDGYSLIQQVRQRFAGKLLPALALTAYARAEDRVRALMAGFQMHVPKPVEPLELIALVASLTDRTRCTLRIT